MTRTEYITKLTAIYAEYESPYDAQLDAEFNAANLTDEEIQTDGEKLLLNVAKTISEDIRETYYLGH